VLVTVLLYCFHDDHDNCLSASTYTTKYHSYLKGSTFDLLWITTLLGWSNELRVWTGDTKRGPSEKRTVMDDTASEREGLE
jgi:hypothetical protein